MLLASTKRPPEVGWPSECGAIRKSVHSSIWGTGHIGMDIGMHIGMHINSMLMLPHAILA